MNSIYKQVLNLRVQVPKLKGAGCSSFLQNARTFGIAAGTPTVTPISNTTPIVQRRYPARLTKSGRRIESYLRRKFFVYDTVQNNMPVKELMKVLLNKYVENVGQPGEIVEIRAKDARYLLLTHQAVYPTEENMKKVGVTGQNEDNYSSRYVKHTIDYLSKRVLNVSMNKENPWTIEPWHIRVAFRKAHIIVPESAITLPKHPINGPDLALEEKEFYVTVTINKTEQVIVRCRVHHWATKLEDRLPWKLYPFKQPADPIFQEDKEIAAKLPPIEPLNMTEEEIEMFNAKIKAKAVKTSSPLLKFSQEF